MSLDQLGPATTSDGPVVATVTLTGELDDAAAARLLRWCEARLHLHDIGQLPVGHLLVDLGRARHAGLAAVAILDHARTEAERRRVGIHLVGAGPLMAAAPPQVRQRLGRWRTFPSLDVARAALVPPGGAHRPVDPDAIVLGGTPHDRLR
jgi:STAS domain-containing protein